MKQSVKRLKNCKERVWSLGTDTLPESDLIIMDAGKKTIFTNEFGAGYSTYLGDNDTLLQPLRDAGYSETFCEILLEAADRGYNYVWFDRDVETQWEDENVITEWEDE